MALLLPCTGRSLRPGIIPEDLGRGKRPAGAIDRDTPFC